MNADDAVEAIVWYRRCLECAQDGRAVFGMQEAKLAHDRAVQFLSEPPAADDDAPAALVQDRKDTV